MVTCETFRGQLENWFGGELDPVQERRMDVHRKACVSCNRQYGEMFDSRLGEKGLFGVDVRHPFEECLNEETLRECLAGTLDAEEAEYVRSHSAECFSCQFHLEGLQSEANVAPATAKPALTSPENREMKNNTLTTQPQNISESTVGGAEGRAPTDSLSDRIKAWVNRIRPRIQFENVAAAILDVSDVLLRRPSASQSVRAGTGAVGYLGAGDEVSQPTGELAVSLSDVFGGQLLQQCVEPIPQDIRDEVARELGKQFIKEKLPWSNGDIRIRCRRRGGRPGSPEVSFAAFAKAAEPSSGERGALRIILVRPGAQDLQSVLTADCRSDAFCPIQPDQHPDEEKGTIELRIEFEEAA